MTLLRTRTEGRFWSRCRLLLWLLLLELFDGKTYFAFFINRQNLYFYLVLFAEESDERQTDLRRKTDSKRGGRGARRSD